MDEHYKKELASAIKWMCIIIVAAVAYSKNAPNYHFIRQKDEFFRAHKVTGSVEHLKDNEWVSMTENEMGEFLRLERKERKLAQAEQMIKDYKEIKESPEDEEEFDEEPCEIDRGQRW